MRNILILMLLLSAGPALAADRSVMLTEFERLRVEGPFAVRVVSAGRRGARISGDRDAQDRVALRQQGSTVVVGVADMGWNGWRDKGAQAVVTIVAPQLRAATVNGGGRLSVERMRGQRIELTLNGAGSLAVGAVEADQLIGTVFGTGALSVGGATGQARFTNDGNGSIAADALKVRALTVMARSVGDTDVRAQVSAQVSNSGVGAVRVAGGAPCMVTGGGPVSCEGDVKR